MQYKAIIFDFFGVISSEVAPLWFVKYFSSAESVELKEKYVFPADVGDITEDDLFNSLSLLTKIPAEQIRQDWLRLASINVLMVDLIKNLRRKYKIALCSNSPTPFLKEIINSQKLNDLFDVIVISSEVGFAKPNPAIYKLVLERLSLYPSETLFIDDNPLNVAAAKQIAIKSLLFTNWDELYSDLKLNGIV